MMEPICDGGNRTLLWSEICDGIQHCQDQFDEQGPFCRQCIDSFYSCPPDDDKLRCDLACSLLGFVPCQTIQDRRACQIFLHEDHLINGFDRSDHLWTFILILGLILVVSLLILITIVRCRSQSLKSSPSDHFYETLHYYEQTTTAAV